MTNREQNHSVELEGDEPQLGVAAQPSPSLPPPPVQMFYLNTVVFVIIGRMES